MQGIEQIFSRIPRTYEQINHILTCGFDNPVRRYTAKLAVARQTKTRARWLDVCTGTGEMAHHLAQHAGGDTMVMAADFALPMLRYAAAKPGAKKVGLTQAEAARLPFLDNTLDLITISFATRNINTTYQGLLDCLREFYRVLKPGGRFINLETSQPTSLVLRKLFHQYVKTLVKPIGSAISGSSQAYTYLARTIPRFYNADEYARIIGRAGFGECRYKILLGGTAAIHQAVKG